MGWNHLAGSKLATPRPLPDASVDVVVCDLPFGRQFGTVDAVAGSYFSTHGVYDGLPLESHGLPSKL